MIGHRKRFRDKFLSSSPNLREIYEMMLIISIPRKDVKPIVHQLQEEFPTLTSLLKSDAQRLKLIDGIGDNTIAVIKTLAHMSYIINEESISNQNLFENTESLFNYCKNLLKGLCHEELWILYLNNKNMLIKSEKLSEGNVHNVAIDFSLLIKQILIYKAKNIVIIHNHPSGDARPSRADIEYTKYLKNTLIPLSINLLDHIIVSDNDVYSFRVNKVVFT